MSTFNPSDKSATITLSNGNLTATSSTAVSQSVRSTTSYASGKLYLEFTMTTKTNDWVVGIANATEGLVFGGGSGLGADGNGAGFYPVSPAQQTYYNGAPVGAGGGSASVNGAVISVAVDLTNHKMWVSTAVMRAAAQTWNNSGTDNPSTNTGGNSFTGLTGPYFAMFNDDLGGAVCVVNFGATSFTQSLPTGFTAWDSGSVATASGTGTATGVGNSAAASVGSATGSSTATATGNSADASVGTATGNGTASATGKSAALSVGSAAGNGAASGIGNSAALSVGSATGSSTAPATGNSAAASIGSSAGNGAAAGVAGAQGSTGSASGSGDAAAVGNSAAAAIASGSGTGAAAGVGTSSQSGGVVVAAPAGGAGDSEAESEGRAPRDRPQSRRLEKKRLAAVRKRRPSETEAEAIAVMQGLPAPLETPGLTYFQNAVTQIVADAHQAQIAAEVHQFLMDEDDDEAIALLLTAI